jgi:hypothetical protein
MIKLREQFKGFQKAEKSNDIAGMIDLLVDLFFEGLKGGGNEMSRDDILDKMSMPHFQYYSGVLKKALHGGTEEEDEKSEDPTE